MKKISTFKLTSLVAGNMIGSGALLAPALLAHYGSISIIGWIITMFGAISLALVFSCLSIWTSKSGGPYTFAKHVFGNFIGFQMAWGYWLSAILGSVSLLAGAIQYTSIFLPEVATPTVSISMGCALIWFFTFINTRGIKSAASAEVVILVIKILPLIVVAVAGFGLINLSQIIHVDDFQKYDMKSLMPMASIMLWSFLGLESATVPINCVENPKKAIPFATIFGVVLTALVYIGGAIAISGLVPTEELLNSKAPYVDAGTKIFGPVGLFAMIVTGIIGIAGSLNGWILIQGQVPMAAAEEGIFPRYFTKINKHGAPVGIVVGSIIMTAVFLLTYQPNLLKHIELMIDAAVFATLVPYFYCVIAFIYLACTRRDILSKVEKALLSVVGFVACLYSTIAILSAGEQMIATGFVMFTASVPFYCLCKKGKQA